MRIVRPVADHDIHIGGDLLELDRHDTETLSERFLPERPGPLVGMHVIQTGHGRCLADRWPNPRAILVEAARNYALLGDPAALTPEGLRPHVEGFVEAQESFAPLLEAAFGQVTIWERVIFSLRAAPRYALPRGFVVRRLRPEDAPYLEGLGPETNWVYKTWYGATAAASSGYFWGAFAGEGLVCAAGPFFLGQRHEEIGVATEPGFRGLGPGAACSGRLCEEIRGRGRVPSWTTSPDNAASVRVAQKLGFTFARDDRLFVVGINAPEPPRRPAAQPKLRPGTEHPDGRA
jgi:GNAT superfamily N-acetyltransferase